MNEFDAQGLEDLDDLTPALLHSHGLYLQATKISEIGALAIDVFLPKNERRVLSARRARRLLRAIG